MVRCHHNQWGTPHTHTLVLAETLQVGNPRAKSMSILEGQVIALLCWESRYTSLLAQGTWMFCSRNDSCCVRTQLAEQELDRNRSQACTGERIPCCQAHVLLHSKRQDILLGTSVAEEKRQLAEQVILSTWFCQPPLQRCPLVGIHIVFKQPHSLCPFCKSFHIPILQAFSPVYSKFLNTAGSLAKACEPW